MCDVRWTRQGKDKDGLPGTRTPAAQSINPAPPPRTSTKNKKKNKTSGAHQSPTTHKHHNKPSPGAHQSPTTTNTSTNHQARIILQDLKVGMKADTVLQLFGQDWKERLEASCNLRRLCAEKALGCVRGGGLTTGLDCVACWMSVDSIGWPCRGRAVVLTASLTQPTVRIPLSLHHPPQHQHRGGHRGAHTL